MLALYSHPFFRSVDTYRQPVMRLTDSGDAIEAELDVPGTPSSDLTITFERGYLTISGKREVHGVDADVSCSTLVRTPIDVDRATARLRDGVLTVVLPKSEAAKPKKIQIQN